MASTNYLFKMLAAKNPELQLTLDKAYDNVKADEFIKKILINCVYITIGLTFFAGALFHRFDKPLWPGLIFGIITGLLCYYYLLQTPKVFILQRNKKVDAEIVYAGKFLIVEINAGVPLYDALKNIAKHYAGVGYYLNVMINKIDLGTNLDQGLEEAIEATDSKNFRKFLWQILNAHQTGADMSQALYNVLEQIQREQMIEVERYGKKLNPVAMFYLMAAVVLPSLGMVMIIIVASFMNISLTITALLLIAAGLGIVQLLFLATIKSMRPAVQL